jgi:hypothetical protein
VDTIFVDTKNPDKNGEFLIIKFKDVKKDGVFRNGFYIELDCDIRDYLEDKYKARLVSPNEILFEMPSVKYAVLHDREERIGMMKEFRIYCESTQGWIDVFRNKIGYNKGRNVKKVMLCFPETIALSTETFYPSSRNGEMEGELVPYSKEVDNNTIGQMKLNFSFIFWKVTILEDELRRYDQASESAKKAVEKLADKLKGTRIW